MEPTTKILLVKGSAQGADLIRSMLSRSSDIEASVDHVEKLGDALEEVVRGHYHAALLVIGKQRARGLQALRHAQPSSRAPDHRADQG